MTNHPAWLIAELRSDHAGETGAVMIYRGILGLCRDPALRDFAERHMATEQGHLRLLEAVLPPADRSRLLPIWRVAGWLTGALPALFGPRAVYATIDAVESFVDRHYQQQIDRLDAERLFPELRAMLRHCQEEEIHHRDEARERHAGLVGAALKAWGKLVGLGSEAAVAAARRM
jgi:ubiquinone biosynthesis monooxygenase Coq7